MPCIRPCYSFTSIRDPKSTLECHFSMLLTIPLPGYRISDIFLFCYDIALRAYTLFIGFTETLVRFSCFSSLLGLA